MPKFSRKNQPGGARKTRFTSRRQPKKRKGWTRIVPVVREAAPRGRPPLSVLRISPGGRWGPCESACQHAACASGRDLAGTPCVVCCAPLGFGVDFRRRAFGYLHLACDVAGPRSRRALDRLIARAKRQAEEAQRQELARRADAAVRRLESEALDLAKAHHE